MKRTINHKKNKKMKKSAVPCHESDKERHFFGGEKKREKIQ
jgi:hypothetical protein